MTLIQTTQITSIKTFFNKDLTIAEMNLKYWNFNTYKGAIEIKPLLVWIKLEVETMKPVLLELINGEICSKILPHIVITLSSKETFSIAKIDDTSLTILLAKIQSQSVQWLDTNKENTWI